MVIFYSVSFVMPLPFSSPRFLIVVLPAFDRQALNPTYPQCNNQDSYLTRLFLSFSSISKLYTFYFNREHNVCMSLSSTLLPIMVLVLHSQLNIQNTHGQSICQFPLSFFNWIKFIFQYISQKRANDYTIP